MQLSKQLYMGCTVFVMYIVYFSGFIFMGKTLSSILYAKNNATKKNFHVNQLSTKSGIFPPGNQQQV